MISGYMDAFTWLFFCYRERYDRVIGWQYQTGE